MAQRTLETLNFDNLSLKALPVDTGPNETRTVPGACFSRIPTLSPLQSPKLVSASVEALQLLDIGPDQVQRPEFVEFMAGNTQLPGSEPAAHCYAGHQFGFFSGQLGDGAAMYLGEVVNALGERWEMQLKGSGLTPYSRAADGRKVLRSSVREFLASEAMFHLGIPTTRAGSVVSSDSRIDRDPYYDGRVVAERCSVVLRIAPTFLRFGSFEIFKPTDKTTGRAGPSVGREAEMLPTMLDHLVRTYLSTIWVTHQGDSLQPGPSSRREDMYLDMYKEVLLRTASLAASWQAVGFCHGVLNTDNMSVLGLTLDYGPYGFMESFDPDHICNGSDDSGRYDYKGQPDICRWNCEKFAEAISAALPTKRSFAELHLYDEEYERAYLQLMRRKLGLLRAAPPSDSDLVKELLAVMAATGSDFSTTFRSLAAFPMPPAAEAPEGTAPQASTQPPQAEGLRFPDGGLLQRLLEGCAPLADLVRRSSPRISPSDLQMLSMLAGRDPMLLQALGMDAQMVAREMEKLRAAAALRSKDEGSKAEEDRAAWVKWLNSYGERLQVEVQAGADERQRVAAMNGANPRFVLRNWLAQHAITRAEEGDYSEVNRLLHLLRNPFSDEDHDTLVAAADAAMLPMFKQQRQQGQLPPGFRYDGLAPRAMTCTRVTCSS